MGDAIAGSAEQGVATFAILFPLGSPATMKGIGVVVGNHKHGLKAPLALLPEQCEAGVLNGLGGDHGGVIEFAGDGRPETARIFTHRGKGQTRSFAAYLAK